MTGPGREPQVGDLIKIRDLDRHGVVTEVVRGPAGPALVCHLGDSGKGDWAAVPVEQAELLEVVRELES